MIVYRYIVTRVLGDEATFQREGIFDTHDEADEFVTKKGFKPWEWFIECIGTRDTCDDIFVADVFFDGSLKEGNTYKDSSGNKWKIDYCGGFSVDVECVEGSLKGRTAEVDAMDAIYFLNN